MIRGGSGGAAARNLPRAAWLLLSGTVALPPAAADVYNVPGDFPTIGTAIFNAASGDEIVVEPGTWAGDLNIDNINIYLHSASGDPADTIIQGSGGGTAVIVNSGGTVIEGFTITGGGCGCSIDGGGMRITGSPTVSNCIFTGNSATNGGGIHVAGGGPVINGCAFVGNTADTQGGGISSIGVSSPTVSNCIFVGNVVTHPTSGTGGGMYIGTGSPKVTDCSFIGNYAGERGGGVDAGSANIDLTNCVFIGNTATKFGGGLSVVNSTTYLTNCSFLDNAVDLLGGGMSVGQGSAVVANCISRGNSPDEIRFVPGTLLLRYSNIEGGLPAGVTDEGGNIDADPLFVDADGDDDTPGTIDDDLRLDHFSPCIDAGDNTVSALMDVTTDLDGAPRFVDDLGVADTGNPPGGEPIVDMGAYERQELSDCNGNGVPDLQDIDPADPDGDGVVWEDYNLNLNPDACDAVLAGDAAWTNAAGGLFRLHSNWDTDTPGPDNGAIFDVDATYTVSFDQDIENTSASVLDGAVSLDLGGFEYGLTDIAATSLLIDGAPPASPSLALSNGAIAAEAAIIADGAASTGQMTMAAAAWMVEDLVVARLGDGTLSIQDGSIVDAISVELGQQAGAFGHVVVDGAGSELTAVQMDVQRGRLDIVNGAEVTILNIFGAVSLFDEGELAGDGTVVGNLLNLGTVTPQDAVGGPETLTVVGAYQQAAFLGDSGVLSARLGPGGSSILQVSAQAVIGGGLIVTLADGFEPALGQQFQVVTSPALDGAFDVAYMPGLPGGNFMRVDYGGAPLGPGGAATIVVENLDSLFGFDDPDGIPITGAPSGVAVGDLDGQNGDDLAITVPNGAAAGSVLVLLNAGTDVGGNWLGFGSSAQYSVGVDPSGIAAGFLDGGSALDLAVSNRGDDTASILINDGAGGFGPASPVPVGLEPSAIAAADYSSDGIVDLVVANAGDDNLQFLINDGSAGFPTGFLRSTGAGPWAIDTSDLDNDKDPDAVSANRLDGTTSVLINLGGGNVAAAVEITVNDEPVDVDATDLDGDGLADIITSNSAAGTVSVVLNDGGGTFRPAVNLPIGGLPRSLVAIDLEADGDADVAVVADDDLGEAVVKVLRNDSVGGQLVLASASELSSGMDPVLVTKADLNGDSQDDLVTVNEGLSAASPPGAGDPGSVNVQLNNSEAVNCAWDCDGNADGIVSVTDLLALLGQYDPQSPANCTGGTCDFNADGCVDVVDLLELLGHYDPAGMGCR